MMNPLSRNKSKKPSDEPKKKRKLLSKKSKDEEAHSRVTNDTLDTHRQAVIKRGRKFKYPFYHSRHKTIIISSVVLITALIVFLAFSVTKLYRYRSYDDFSYALTKIIPFPVAKIDGHMVNYDDYLFELRVTTYSMTHNSGVDFSTADGQRMLASYQRDALNRAETATYAKAIAKQKGVTVNDTEVDRALNSIKSKSLNLKSDATANDTATFDRTIKDEYNWTENDLRHSLQNLLYQQKIAAILDTKANKKVEKIQQALGGKHKKSFAATAKKYSDDKSNASNGGMVGFVTKNPNDKANTSVAGLPQQVLDSLFSLKKAEVSAPIQTPKAVYIVKNNKTKGNKRQLSYIRISYQSLNSYIKDLRKQGKIKEYIRVPEVKATTHVNLSK